MLREKYWPLVEKGKKTITIRRYTDLKPGDLAYIHAGGKIRGLARVVRVYERSVDEIGPEEAKKEGMGLEKLKRELKRIYGDAEKLKIVEFELLETYNPPIDPEELRYGGKTPQQIAREALEKGIVEDRDLQIVKEIAGGKSIREVAFKLGGLKKRRIIRGVLEKYRKKLEELTS
jgi:hypothetical protein